MQRKDKFRQFFQPGFHYSRYRGRANSYSGGYSDKKPNRCSLLFMKGKGTANGIDDEKAGAYTIAHEFAHLVFALYDEYRFGVDANGKDILSTCVATHNNPTLNYCLINNFLIYGGGRDDPTLRQFCVNSNHEKGIVTTTLDANGKPVETIIENRQERFNKCSCWETIAKRKKKPCRPSERLTFHRQADKTKFFLGVYRQGWAGCQQQ